MLESSPSPPPLLKLNCRGTLMRSAIGFGSPWRARRGWLSARCPRRVLLLSGCSARDQECESRARQEVLHGPVAQQTARRLEDRCAPMRGARLSSVERQDDQAERSAHEDRERIQHTRSRDAPRDRPARSRRNADGSRGATGQDREGRAHQHEHARDDRSRTPASLRLLLEIARRTERSRSPSRATRLRSAATRETSARSCARARSSDRDRVTARRAGEHQQEAGDPTRAANVYR